MTQEKNLHYTDGIFVSSKAQKQFVDFEQAYHAIRTREKRILSIDEIKKLPFPDKNSSDFNLWGLRRKNIFRFLNHLHKKKKTLRVLDIGCGNGFFPNMMAQHGHHVVGVDVNLVELKQAAQAFPNEKLKWYYLDLMTEQLPEEPFDVITFCASFHYFGDPKQLLQICKTYLKPAGEIHIIDSPFYTIEEKAAAKQRSVAHFKSLGVEAMSAHYYHNNFDVLNSCNFKFGYTPGRLLAKLLRIKDSPFYWIIIR